MCQLLVDIDEVALAAARAKLGTEAIRDAVNPSLRATAGQRRVRVREGLATSWRARALDDRSDAWL